MKHIGFLISILLLSSCASVTTNRAGLNVITSAAYENVIDQWTDRIEDYSGLSNTVTIQATLLNPQVVMAQADQNARIFQWDQITYDNEKKNAENRMASETQVFVSFYSPERKWDDLYKSKTLWKVFLDANGQRYEGKVAKVKLLTPEIQSLYHYHTGFATPYLITFPVSARTLGSNPAKLIFTGAIGSVTLSFGPK